MDLLEGLFTRRSIRQYLPGVIPDDFMNKILKAGMAAPSANNCQPWHFLVINDRKKMLDITKIQPFSLIFIGFPVEEKTPSNRYISERVHYNFWRTK